MVDDCPKVYPQAGCQWISRPAGLPSRECRASPGREENERIWMRREKNVKCLLENVEGIKFENKIGNC